MELKTAFGIALRQQRLSKKLSQEAFSGVSSRTYMSALERGLKNPSLEKIEDIANTLEIHPLTLLTHCYILRDDECTEDLLSRVERELL